MRLAPAVPFALAAAGAALQVGVASRWAGAEDHLGAVALGWGGALALVWARRPRPQHGSHAPEVLAGGAVFASACALAIASAGAYRWFDRLLPLVTGVALVVLYSGARQVSTYTRELALLAVPLVQPLPGAVQRAVMPLRETAVASTLLLRALGFPAEVRERFILVPNATLEVQGGCSGLGAMAQLLALAILLLVVFPTTRVQKLLVLLSALGVGFAANAGRVAFLAVVASRAPDDYAYYERYGMGSLAFPVVASVLAGAVWWAVLRVGRAPAAEAGTADLV